MAGIKHAATKGSGEKGLASEWNADHIINGNVDFDSNKIINLTDPTANQEGATKKYVDDKYVAPGVIVIKNATGLSTSSNVEGEIDNVTIPAGDSSRKVRVTVFAHKAGTGNPTFKLRIDRDGTPADTAEVTGAECGAQIIISGDPQSANIADYMQTEHEDGGLAGANDRLTVSVNFFAGTWVLALRGKSAVNGQAVYFTWMVEIMTFA